MLGRSPGSTPLEGEPDAERDQDSTCGALQPATVNASAEVARMAEMPNADAVA
jgi:hypothetical protein